MLSQVEADALMQMARSFVEAGTISIAPGTDQTHELIGEDRRERFLLDL